MDKDFQTSFIPKKSLSEERVVREHPVSLAIFIATLVFFAALLAAGGVYFYKLSLVKQIASGTAQLEKAKAAFEPKLIEDLQTLDRRLHAAEEVLGTHIQTSPIFTSLEAITLKTIQYTKFGYQLSADAGAPAIVVAMSGRARDYTSIALQSDKFGENKYFKDPVFSNLALEEKTGNVTFDLSFVVDPSFVSFAQIVSQGLAGAEDAGEVDAPLPENITESN